MPRFTALPLLMLTALAACGTVAPEAPALLSAGEIASRTEGAADSARGQQAADTLAWRAARLQARAAALRRNGLAPAERGDLLQRAEELKRGQS